MRYVAFHLPDGGYFQSFLDVYRSPFNLCAQNRVDFLMRAVDLSYAQQEMVSLPAGRSTKVTSSSTSITPRSRPARRRSCCCWQLGFSPHQGAGTLPATPTSNRSTLSKPLHPRKDALPRSGSSVKSTHRTNHPKAKAHRQSALNLRLYGRDEKGSADQHPLPGHPRRGIPRQKEW